MVVVAEDKGKTVFGWEEKEAETHQETEGIP